MSESLLQDFLAQSFEALQDGSPLASSRRAAWERFEQLGLPSRRSEPFRHVPLNTLYKSPWHPPVAEPVDRSFEGPTLLFINGHYVAGSVEGKALLLSLPEAMGTYGPYLERRLAQLASEESDPFALLNGATHQGGAFLYLPPGEQLGEPIRIIHQISADAPPLVRPRFHLFAGAGSKATFHVSIEGEGWSNSLHDLHLEKGAQVFWRQTAAGCVTDALRVTQKRESRFSGGLFSNGGKLVRSDMRLHLEEPGAEGELLGGWHLRDADQTHVSVRVEHRAPNCRSRQHFKGALSDSAVSSFAGTIYVASEAQQTDAFQLNNNLLLGARAQAHSRPNLEIFADDVKASHGATFGQLDEESLTYLRTRGIGEAQARALLVEGFIREVTEKFPPSLLG